MNIPIEQLKQRVARVPDSGNERSLYPALCNFFEDYGKIVFKLKAPQAVVEESLAENNKHVGFPDITIRNGEKLIGWIEVKIPSESLDNDKFKAQFSKYKDSLENIIFTNLREWQLWQWAKGEKESEFEPKQTATAAFDATKVDGSNTSEIENLLTKFFEGRAHATRTPKQLALALAKKTRLLSKQVEEALDQSDAESDLSRLRETFEKTLIQDISSHQFANMVAETVAYSLFLAALEHTRRGSGAELTLTNAIDYLPMNVPILADLYTLIKKVSTTIPTITDAARLLVDQLNASDIKRIHQKLIEHKPGEDPVIQFYEPFLNEYDPKEREARGVYYTPKPVVDYIVQSVDHILRSKFDKARGLADDSVHLLDPATGTGTFLMSAIQTIHSNIKKDNTSLGDEMVNLEFNKVVVNHILKHFYGFELLIAPYAIAHLKLTLEVERLGFNFLNTKFDEDKDNDRFKIYLANTLDDPNKPPAKLFGFDSIPQESEKAREVKKNTPILAIIGNPPYSNFGQMNRSKWILELLKDYKKDLKEKKINLDDDFIKFIRFAQWKLEQTGQGVFAMITSNTFIDGITHRQMRNSLIDTFDEIYIYNLHGNKRKGEVAPDYSDDQNIFNIMTGVSINIFIKLPEKKEKTIVRYCDLWGLREKKFATLLNESFSKTNWKVLTPKEPNFFFVEKNTDVDEEYEAFYLLPQVFPIHNSGLHTKRDGVTIQYTLDEMKSVVRDFTTLSEQIIRSKYDLPADGRDWILKLAQKDLQTNKTTFQKVQYRPYDYRFTAYTGKTKGFIAYPRKEVLSQLTKPNLSLIAMKQVVQGATYSHTGVSATPIDERTFYSNRGGTYIFPLYLYSESKQSNLLEEKGRRTNLSPEFIKRFSEKLQLRLAPDGRGDLKNTYGPEDIFYYSHAILSSPDYRSRYTEQLRINFPRLPLTSDKKLFKELVILGNELVNLSLLGENPFDTSKTIFDDPSAWSITIGGKKPENLKDWQLEDISYDRSKMRVYVNSGQYFEGIETGVWEFMVGGYQVCEKWLKDRKKAGRALSTEDIRHYMKTAVSIRETIRVTKEIDRIVASWPLK